MMDDKQLIEEAEEQIKESREARRMLKREFGI